MRKFLALALLFGCMHAVCGQTAKSALDGKTVFDCSFPQYLTFRGEARKPYQASYEAWAESIGNSCGFMRKLVNEELDINPETAEWTIRYAGKHPEIETD